MTHHAHARHQFVIRVRIVLGLAVFLMLLLSARLYSLQIVHSDTYRIAAQGQYVSSYGGFYDRGNIFFVDKDGREVSAATVKTGYILAITPYAIENPQALCEALGTVVPLEQADCRLRAQKIDDPYEELVHRLSQEEADTIRALALDGVTLVTERWRFYPGDTLAAQAIGFTAYDGDERAGRYGLERYFEDVLKRESSTLYVNFFADLFANVRDVAFVPAQKREGDIVTTIEPSVQAYLEDELSAIRERWHSKTTAGIIMDPKTGEIRALAISPSFNLNDFSSEHTSVFANTLVEDVYEMGSIIKPLTVAAGIDSGAITAATTYTDTGTRTFDGRTISNYDGRGRGVVSMQEVLNQSLNTGVAFAVEKMGKDTFRRYMYRYGFNEETGIDLPNEAHNLINNLTSPRDIEYATASFGQGVAFSPISTIRALAALSTGVLVQPHVVSAIHSKNGITQNMTYEELEERVLSPESAEAITRMLVAVVDDALAGGTVALPHHSIAAKTGTAQIASPSGGYYDDRYLHTFFGYFPAYEPRYIIFLMNLEPQNVKYASQTLTDPFMDLAKYLINYYNIPPDR